jgi:hypothetical protein
MSLQLLLPDERLSSIHDLDFKALAKRGIEGIIFDLDNTLGAWGFTRMEEKTLDYLQGVKRQGFRLGFLSNDHGEGREAVQQSLADHPMIFNARKPTRSGYREILENFKLQPHQTAMVGDQIFTDIFGAKRLGIYTIMVDPVDPKIEDRAVRFRRLLERQILRFKR